MKKKKLSGVLSFILIFLLIGQSTFANPTGASQDIKEGLTGKVEKLTSKTIHLGTINKGTENFKIGRLNLPTYDCMNVSYILMSDLKKAGANVSWDKFGAKAVIHNFNDFTGEHPVFDSLSENTIGYLGRDAVYINNQEIPAIFADGQTLIPAKWITMLLGQNSNPINQVREDKQPGIEEPEVIEEEVTKIEEIDKTDETKETDEIKEIEEIEEIREIDEMEKIIGVEGINIWFDGKDYLEKTFDFSRLEPGEYGYFKDHSYHDHPEYDYVGFVITRENGIQNPNASLHKAWLKNPTYYTVPVGIGQDVLKALFPTTRVTGLMKYAAGGFKKDEEVTVFNASSGRAYHLFDKKGKLVTIPWNSISIKQSPVTKKEASQEEIEAYINSMDFGSKTNYFVWTDIYRQRTYVFKGSKNKWELIRNMISTTGKDTTLTPTGRYTLNVRVPKFGMNKGYQVKNAYAFIGTTYLYHSVVYDKTGSYLLNGWGELGSKGSSGCIRLSEQDSAWLYQTMPIGTSIFIN